VVARGKAYQRPKQRLGLLRTSAAAAALIAIVWSGVMPELLARWALDAWPLEVFIVVTLTFFLIGLPGLPSEIWQEFVHEKRWGFSTQTWRGYLADQIKELLVFGIVLPAIMIVPLWWFIRAVDGWWLWGSVALAVLSFVLGVVWPVLLLPIFNKFTPLEDEALRARLDALAQRAGIGIKQFLVMDASKRSRQDNAFFVGMGATRRIVIYDTMLTMPPECLEVVVAHEIGHWRKRHTFWGGVLTTATLPLLLGITAAIVSSSAVLDWAGVGSLGDPGAVPLFILIAGGVQTVLGRAEAWFSRWFERQADHESLELTKAPEAFAAAWQQMVDRNVPDVAPTWWRRTKMSHPPIAERISFGERWAMARAPA
jgi:STE24 endopeptidase